MLLGNNIFIRLKNNIIHIFNSIYFLIPINKSIEVYRKSLASDKIFTYRSDLIGSYNRIFEINKVSLGHKILIKINKIKYNSIIFYFFS